MSLYPAIKPYDTRNLAVSDLHTLHVEQYGKPDGLPCVFLHGGVRSLSLHSLDSIMLNKCCIHSLSVTVHIHSKTTR